MAGRCNTKNDEFERLERRKKVANLYLAGKPMHQIAVLIGVSSPQTVCNDLAAIREEWSKSALVDFNAARAKELAKIDRLEEVAWEAWERSCLDAESKTIERDIVQAYPKTKDGKTDYSGKPKPVVTGINEKLTKKGQVGDDRFLARVAWCIEMRVKLLCLIKEEKQAPVVVNINFDDLAERSPVMDPIGPRLIELQGGEPVSGEEKP